MPVAQAAYPRGAYERLAEIKGHYDPTNRFHLNQNIRPSVAVRWSSGRYPRNWSASLGGGVQNQADFDWRPVFGAFGDFAGRLRPKSMARSTQVPTARSSPMIDGGSTV